MCTLNSTLQFNTTQFQIIVNLFSDHVPVGLGIGVHDTSQMKISYQPYMQQIQEIFYEVREKYPELQIGRYSTHSGRDTYISICVQNKASMKNILTWVGQSSYRIMDRYIKLTPESQKAEVNSVFKTPSTLEN